MAEESTGTMDAEAFLSRETELLGDEFKTDQDHAVSESEDDLAEFKEQFPEVVASDNEVSEPLQDQESDNDDAEFEGFSLAPTDVSGDSEPLREWRERRDLEIASREKASSSKKEEIMAKARQTIDDFYDNYNQKRDERKKTLETETETFLDHRDKFLSRGTLWDRVDELIGKVGEVPDAEGRDKSRFASLLKSLRGKENVPGAGGYTDPKA